LLALPGGFSVVKTQCRAARGVKPSGEVLLSRMDGGFNPQGNS
jgi:hypothetical protein